MPGAVGDAATLNIPTGASATPIEVSILQQEERNRSADNFCSG
jgi:hypothetical protein